MGRWKTKWPSVMQKSTVKGSQRMGVAVEVGVAGKGEEVMVGGKAVEVGEGTRMVVVVVGMGSDV
jgi:hypothetical protein